MYPEVLKARRDTLDEGLEYLTIEQLDLVEKYIDKFIDNLEYYAPSIRSGQI